MRTRLSITTLYKAILVEGFQKVIKCFGRPTAASFNSLYILQVFGNSLSDCAVDVFGHSFIGIDYPLLKCFADAGA